ncbi:ATP-binding protein [Novosphingobium sp. RD2P27]|uniref:histidine kinase n=1 Tax=Novosphingobium kalidii TaxID=3230299 RepID=A0ABV2D4L6_9SPHN
MRPRRVIFGLNSLLSRILWWHGVAVVFTAVAVSAGVYLFLDSTADHFQRETLRVHAESARKSLRLGLEGQVQLATSEHLTKLPRTFSLSVMDGGGRRLASSSPTAIVPTDRIPRGGAPTYFKRRSRSAIYSGYSMPVPFAGSTVWVVVVQNLEHPDYIVDDVLRQFFVYGLFIVLPLLLLLLVVDAWIVRRALGPVMDASTLVRTLHRQQLDVRIPEARLPSEVRPLASAVNAALNRVIESYRTQRDFTADAAHELRTPIALARMRVESVSEEALRSALKRDLDQLGRTVSQLLEIAELDGVLPAMDDTIDLRALAAETVSAIAPLVFRRRQSIALTGSETPVVVRGNAEMIARALKGLVENAVTHTPAGTAIEVDVQTNGILSVLDNGPGIKESEQELVFRRFWRGDRTTANSSGLGLAIVSRIAEAHGAKVSLRTRAGETVFAIRFPVQS